MFRKIRDYLFGIFSLTAVGGFQNEFIGFCRKNGVILTDVRIKGDVLTAHTRPFCMAGIRKAAKQSGMQIEFSSLYGLPALLSLCRKRLGIPIGMLSALLVIGILSSFIWSVEITCPDTLDCAAVTTLLEENGLKRGATVISIDCNTLEDILKSFSDEVADAVVNQIGCRVFVTIYTREKTTDISLNDYCNIVAAKGGEIIKADIFAGEGSLSPGLAVARGDLLVSGTKVLKDGQVRFVKAEADIIARTENTVSTSAAFQIKAFGIDRKYDLYAPVLFLSFFKEKEPVRGCFFTETDYLTGTDTLQFPIGLTRRRTTRYTETDIFLSEQQATLIALGDLMSETEHQYGDAVIISQTTNILINNGITLECRVICEENIAHSLKFNVDIIDDEQDL